MTLQTWLLAAVCSLCSIHSAHATRTYDVNFQSGENSLSGSITTDGLGPIGSGTANQITSWTFRQRGPVINFDLSSTDKYALWYSPGGEIPFIATESSLIYNNIVAGSPDDATFYLEFPPEELTLLATYVAFMPIWVSSPVELQRVQVFKDVGGGTAFEYGIFPAPISFPRRPPAPQPASAPGTMANLGLALMMFAVGARRARGPRASSEESTCTSM